MQKARRSPSNICTTDSATSPADVHERLTKVKTTTAHPRGGGGRERENWRGKGFICGSICAKDCQHRNCAQDNMLEHGQLCAHSAVRCHPVADRHDDDCVFSSLTRKGFKNAKVFSSKATCLSQNVIPSLSSSKRSQLARPCQTKHGPLPRKFVCWHTSAGRRVALCLKCQRLIVGGRLHAWSRMLQWCVVTPKATENNCWSDHTGDALLLPVLTHVSSESTCCDFLRLHLATCGRNTRRRCGP